VTSTAREVFEAYGYGRIQTPTFEETEVFSRGVGESTDIVRKEMYTFADGSGRSLTLRPEGTAPVVRAFVEHGMHKLQLPVKLWYLASMFRYEAPQAGRYREHTQIGIEAIGSDDPLLDAEVICALADVYGRLGVPGVTLNISSMGDPDTHAGYRPRLIANPLRLFDSKEPRVREIMAGAPTVLDHLSPAARAHHDRVLAALDALGIAYVEDPTLVRGLDYYTKTVFEFSCDRLGAQSGIGGGGRYDGLVEELGGPPTPGIGFGSGVERITLALEAADLAGEEPVLDCYLAIPDDDLRLALMPLIRRLRAAGIRCDSDLRGRGLKAMLRQAASLGARHTAIVGPREHAAGVATVRDMASGDQREVPLDQLAEALR
jgi:histidyl-tRNA synthetase